MFHQQRRFSFPLFLLCTAFFLAMPQELRSQTLNGNASLQGADCIRLTPNQSWQSGSAFFPDTVNLNHPFEFLFYMNFGSADQNGADGMVFILQNNDANQLGTDGGSLGYGGIPNSLGIEFDTFENVPFGDPTYDHIAVFRDGMLDHNLLQALGGPTPAIAGNGNIEDGQDHLVEIRWDPNFLRLAIFFDCQQRLVQTIDLVGSIFGGDSLVYWGFSAASGGSFNQHQVCFPQPAPGMLDSALTCGGDSVVLTAPFSRGLNYAWEPAYNISALDQRSVTVWPDNDTIYTVYYLDNCGLEHTDTFVVSISPDPEIDLGNDTTLCTGENLLLEPELDQGNFSWSNDSTADTLMVDSSGLYILQVLTGPGCMDTDSIEVNFVDPPVVFTNPDTTICGTEEPYQLIAFPVAAETDYVWSTGDTAETLNVSSTGDYVIEAINGCSTATDTARIVFFPHEEGYFIPNVFSPNGDGINDRYLVENFRPAEFEVQVFDRWGRQMFITNTVNTSWDGNLGGKPAPAGTYYYQVRTRDCRGYVVREQGHLTLVR